MVKLSAHRAGLPGKDGSSFDRLTMTAHHDDTGNALSLPVLSACPESIEGCRRTRPNRACNAGPAGRAPGQRSQPLSDYLPFVTHDIWTGCESRYWGLAPLFSPEQSKMMIRSQQRFHRQQRDHPHTQYFPKADIGLRIIENLLVTSFTEPPNGFRAVFAGVELKLK
jgi:hypothetical protein